MIRYFSSAWDAYRFFSACGYGIRDVALMIQQGRAVIGWPDVPDGGFLRLDNAGQYFIENPN